MADFDADILVVGGGINGAAIARDAAGRGLKVVLAERGDYACATSSASSKLIHGGLRYLEQFEFKLVRESLKERDTLLRTAPHLVQPIRFLVPIYAKRGRPAWMVHLGLRLYDFLAGSRKIARSGRLSEAEIAGLPRLRTAGLDAVLHYSDCQVDDARLVLATLLDARARGADIANRREVTSIMPTSNGYSVEIRDRFGYRTLCVRFVVNTAGPWANQVVELCPVPLPEHNLRLVRGSHIVLRMPQPRQIQAFTLQNTDGRVIFTIPWLGGAFLMIGTTDVPHRGDASGARCSDEERDYLLDVYNRHFAHPGGPATPKDIIWSWAGVRPLVDDGEDNPSKITRDVRIVTHRQGTGGFVTVYGGKLTTHRRLAEKVMSQIAWLGCAMSRSWTQNAPLTGGRYTRRQLWALAEAGPPELHIAVRRRWAMTYGDVAETLFETVRAHPEKTREIAPRILLAELEHAVRNEDAASADDFLYRRTKLFLSIDAAGRKSIDEWFA